MPDTLTFGKGFKDGIPILLGYLSVGFAFGMLSVTNGMPLWSPIVISLSNFTGTGQFVGMDMIVNGAVFAELACTIFIINIRYILMSITLSQKLDDNVTTAQRFIIAFGNTDEIFAVSMQQKQLLSFRYMTGLILCSYLGWIGGTALGTFASGFLPQSIISALGIAIYAMFLAIIIPPARESKQIFGVIGISVIISCLFNIVPYVNKVERGWVIIIAGVISSAIGAKFFPPETEER